MRPLRPSPSAGSAGARRAPWLLALVVILLATPLLAHNVSEKNAGFVEGSDGAALVPFAYLGAKHMVTGYDHLLFLVGVVFFLHRLRDVVIYVSFFTLGHSATLLLGVLGDLRVDAYLIDAIIGLSVVYKGFENVGGLDGLRWRPDPKYAVLVFGLCHGLGLATKLQDFTLSPEGLVANILSFNVGVEIGQILALSLVVVALLWWRKQPSFERWAVATNCVLMVLGFVLAGIQLFGYTFYP